MLIKFIFAKFEGMHLHKTTWIKKK